MTFNSPLIVAIGLFVVITFANALPTENADAEQFPSISIDDATPPTNSQIDETNVLQAEDSIDSKTDPRTNEDETDPLKIHNGKPIDDKFYDYYSHPEVGMEKMIETALSWNAEKQRHHFEFLHSRVQAKEKDAQLAELILNGVQQLLDESLQQVQSKIAMSVDEYITYMDNIQNGITIKDQEVMDVLQRLEQLKNDALEIATSAGDQIQEEEHLRHLTTYEQPPVVQQQQQ